MSKKEIRRRFVELNNNFFHYLESGSGFPIVLLHESPKSSFAHMSLIRFLSVRYKIFALDTPGYGFSDPIKNSKKNISDFAILINQIISSLGIKKFILYGNHTGASIAIEYGKLFPGKLRGLILESLPIFFQNEVQGILKNFFSPLIIKQDGSHLTSIWSKVEDQNIWFPWYERTNKQMHHWPHARPVEMHEYVMDFIRAGDSYRHAYSAAFNYNSFLTVKKLNIPTKFISVKSDILFSHKARLPKLKKNQELIVINDFTKRMKAIDYSINSFSKINIKKQEKKFLSKKSFLDINCGQVYYQIIRNENSKNPVLFLIHELPGSSEELQDLMIKISKKRTVVSFDIPGIGNSFVEMPKPFNMKFFVKIFDDLINELGVNNYDIYGKGFGGYLSLYLSRNAFINPRKIILDRVKILTKKEKDKLNSLNINNLNIKEDGSHLISTWKMIINSKIYFPFYNKRAMILTHKLKDFDPKKIDNIFISIFNNPKTYISSFKKIINCDPNLYIKNISNYILIIKESVNKEIFKDKNLKINNTKKNIIVKKYNSERNLIIYINNFLN